MSTEFKIGDEVQCNSDPSLVGTIVEVCESHGGIQYYRVNFGPAGRPIKAAIDLRSFTPNPTPGDNLLNGHIDEYEEFQRLMTYQRLLRDHPLRNNIYAFNASRTRFYPYQFKPLLKFLNSPKNRLLIADEVGLGKTIEAGLILTELRARQTIQRVLIVCPANLTDKWRMEMKKRFGEDFKILNTQAFLRFLEEHEESPHESKINGIVSLESIRRQNVLKQIENLAPAFDIVIVDEAHHMRNFGKKQRRAGILLSECADTMLLLTATPIHLGNENLFSLLNIMDDEEFPDFYTVDERFRKNEPIIKAQICLGQIPPNTDDAIELIKTACESPWIKNNPISSEVAQRLEEIKKIDFKKHSGKSLVLQAQRDLAELNLIGHIFTRTKKREVHTNMAIRRAFPLRLRLTPIERQFYDAVTMYVREQSTEQTHSPLIQNWMLIMPQRRMASSIPAMVEYYREHFDLKEQDLSEDQDISDEELNDVSGSMNLLNASQILKTIVSKWPKDGPDSKYAIFIDLLRTLRKNEGPLRIMVFAFFKDTLRYLQKHLTKDGFKCVVISGDIHPDERVTVVEKFKEDPSYEIILSSRVGSEGLDFQFCNVLFNYDLPWNPMEIEQRIGRLDRIGQESPVIRIYNFWIEETIEQRILDRLYSRIGIFERSIGELEMILGDELSTIEWDILSKKLTPKEEEEFIDQKAMVIMSRLDSLERLEKDAAKFIGTDQYFDEEVQMIKINRRYITGEQMIRFIIDFIRIICPRTRLDYTTDTHLGKIHPDEILRSILTRYSGVSEASRYLTTASQGISITFDSQTAFDKPKVDFINVLHPLTQSIAKYYTEHSIVHSNAHHVKLRTERLPLGFYLYFVYRLRIHAARSSNTIETIILKQDLNIACNDEDSEILLGEMVEKGENSRGIPYMVDPLIARNACKRATEMFHIRVEKIREDISRYNDAFVNRRLESIRTSYGKNLKMRRALLQEAVTKKQQDRIIRLHEGIIRRLESELEEKKRNMEAQRSIHIDYDDIAAGILEIV